MLDPVLIRNPLHTVIQNSLSFKERAGVRMGRCRIFEPIPTLILPLKGRKLV